MVHFDAAGFIGILVIVTAAIMAARAPVIELAASIRNICAKRKNRRSPLGGRPNCRRKTPWKCK